MIDPEDTLNTDEPLAKRVIAWCQTAPRHSGRLDRLGQVLATLLREEYPAVEWTQPPGWKYGQHAWVVDGGVLPMATVARAIHAFDGLHLRGGKRLTPSSRMVDRIHRAAAQELGR